MTARIDIASCRKALTERLHDTRGFMIGEQLISIIFIGLLCIAVAAGLHAAMNSYSKITLQTQADAMLLNAVEVVSDELVYALGVEADDDAPTEDPTFVSATQKSRAGFVSDSRGIWMTFESESGKYPVCFVSAQNGLVPHIGQVLYFKKAVENDDGSIRAAGSWSFEVGVYAEGSYDESGSPTGTPLAETTMTVKRIGS